MRAYYYFIFSIVDKENERKNRSIIKYLVSSIALSSVLEYVQSIIPNRAFNIIDLVLNYAGIIFGTLFSQFIFAKIWFRKKLLLQKTQDYNKIEAL